MAEYGSMLAVSLLASILFLGGWHGPVPLASMLGLTFDNGFWWGFAGNVLGAANIIFKGVIGVTVMMWVRWTLPRLRIDQVITTCLKYCVPMAAVAFLGATLWQYWLPGRAFFGIKRAPARSFQIAELWPQAAAPVSPTSEEPKPAQPVDEAANHESDSRPASAGLARMD
jgi:NADH-quinone oxidoreductase subunit H